MASASVQEQITEQLLHKLDEARYLHVPLMKRIDGRIRSKEQLESLIAVLVRKLEASEFRDAWLIDQIDKLTSKLERLERYEHAS